LGFNGIGVRFRSSTDVVADRVALLRKEKSFLLGFVVVGGFSCFLLLGNVSMEVVARIGVQASYGEILAILFKFLVFSS